MPTRYEDYSGPCIYCGGTNELTKEHVFPKAMGGSLEVKTVCRTCNSRFGTELDWHLQVIYARTMLDQGLVEYVVHAEPDDPWKRWRLYRDGRVEQDEPSSHSALPRRRRIVSETSPNALGGYERVYEVASADAWERLKQDEAAAAERRGKAAHVEPLEVKPRPATVYPVSGTGCRPEEVPYSRALVKVALNAVIWGCGPKVAADVRFKAAKQFVCQGDGGGFVEAIPGSDNLGPATPYLKAELLPYSEMDGTTSVIVDLFHSVRLYRVAVASGGPVPDWNAQVVSCRVGPAGQS